MKVLDKLKEKYQINSEFNTVLIKQDTSTLIQLGLSISHNLAPLKIAETREDFPHFFKQITQEYFIDRIHRPVTANPIENIQWLIKNCQQLNIDLTLSKKIDLMLSVEDYRAKTYLFEIIYPELEKIDANPKEIDYVNLLSKMLKMNNREINIDLLFELPHISQWMKYGDKKTSQPNFLLSAFSVSFAPSHFTEFNKMINDIKEFGINMNDNSNVISDLENFISTNINYHLMTDDSPIYAISLLLELKNNAVFLPCYEYFKQTLGIYFEKASDLDKVKAELTQLEAIALDKNLTINTNQSKRLKV